MKQFFTPLLALSIASSIASAQVSKPLNVDNVTGRITGPVDPATFTEALEASSYALDAGSTDAYRADLSPARIGYTVGMRYRFRANTANTGACSLTFNGHPAAAIKRSVSGSLVDLSTGDIRALDWVEVVWNGTVFQMMSAAGTSSGGGGSGTVTHTAGALTLNGVLLGAGTDDSKVVAGMTSDGISQIILGVAGTSVGSIAVKNATSGTITISPPTGALGTIAITWPNAASVLPIFGQQVTITGPTAARTYAWPDVNAAFLYSGGDAGTPSAIVLSGGTGLPIIGGTTGTLTVARGGTGLSAINSGGIPYGSSTSQYSSTGVLGLNSIIVGGGAGGAPTSVTTGANVLNALSNTANATSGVITVGGATIGVAQGGTNLTSYAIGDILYASGATTISKLADVATGSILVSGGVATAPAWSANPTVTSVTTGSLTATTVLAKADKIQAPNIVTLSSSATDTYVGTTTTPITAYVTGTQYVMQANTANTGAASLNIDTVGAKTIVKVVGGVTTALADNDIRVNQICVLAYDGTNLQLQSTLGNAAAATSLTSTQVGYGDGSNAVTGEAAFAYNATTNVVTVGAVTLGAGSEVSTIGPLVDSVDGTTPLNNVNQVVAAGTAYTLTTSYAAVDFGTTDPVLTIANAGTYAVFVDVQTSLVSATTTTQSASFKLSRTNNTAADLAGSTFGSPLPIATVTSELGPSIHIGPIKYTTTNTNDTLTVQGIISASLGAGTATVTNATITAIREY